MGDVTVSNNVIGQMYENRKTHKIGVIERIEEKYKTLLLRDSEGKSFNISFSTFNSSWRKYKGDEVIKTSSQTTQEREEKKAQEVKESAKKESAKARIPQKRQESKEYTVKIFNMVKTLVSDPYNVILTGRGGIKVKKNRSIQFEIWPHVSTDNMSLLVTDELWNAAGKYATNEVEEEPKYTFHESYKVPHEIEITEKYLKFYVDETLKALNTINTEKEDK